MAVVVMELVVAAVGWEVARQPGLLGFPGRRQQADPGWRVAVAEAGAGQGCLEQVEAKGAEGLPGEHLRFGGPGCHWSRLDCRGMI